jgi:hypothetical protein
VVFRDLSGAVGLLELHCPHRGASLEFGLIDAKGIRCCYHGWQFAADGTVLDTPRRTGSQHPERPSLSWGLSHPGGRALFVEPDVLEAPAVIGAVDHDVQPLDLAPPAGRIAVDLPNELPALRLIGFHRLLVDHLLDLGIAVMRVVAVRLAAVILIESLVGVVDAGTRHTLRQDESLPGEPVAWRLYDHDVSHYTFELVG